MRKEKSKIKYQISKIVFVFGFLWLINGFLAQVIAKSKWFNSIEVKCGTIVKGECGGSYSAHHCSSKQRIVYDATFDRDSVCGGDVRCENDPSCEPPPPNNPPNPPQPPNTTATTASGVPTQTGTPATRLAATEGTEELCQSLVSSKNIINVGETFTLTATSKNNTDIQTFDFLFFNKDTGKAIKFTAGEYKIIKTLTVFKNIFTTDPINYTDFLFPDLNWPNYYANWPKNIIVEAYLHQSATKWSKFDQACRIELKINSIQPTPTPNPNCVCASGSCTAAPTCLFDTYTTGFTYNTPIKCNADNNLYYSAPTDTNKTGWCQSYLRQKGDANGDGKVDALDYFYFVSVKSAGAKIPATVNVDFNGDGNITNDGDRVIIIKTLKQI